MRKIGFKLNPKTKTISLNDYSDPTRVDFLRSHAKRILIEIDEVGLNNCLCEHELFNC